MNVLAGQRDPELVEKGMNEKERAGGGVTGRIITGERVIHLEEGEE